MRLAWAEGMLSSSPSRPFLRRQSIILSRDGLGRMPTPETTAAAPKRGFRNCFWRYKADWPAASATPGSCFKHLGQHVRVARPELRAYVRDSSGT